MIIHCWRGVLMHIIYASVQPLYLMFRILCDSTYLNRCSPIWLTITVMTWVYIVTRISIPFLTSPLRHLPSGPGERIPWGHFRLSGNKLPIDRLTTISKVTSNNGLLVHWGIFYLFCEVCPTRCDTVMEVLNSHNYDWEKPSPSKRLLKPILGDGLILVEGDQHKLMRKAVAPAFSGSTIRGLVPLFYGKGLAFANVLAAEAKKANDQVVEMMGQMSRVTLDIIEAAGMGKDFNTIENDDDPLAHLYAMISDTEQGSLFVFFLINFFLPSWLVQKLRGTVHAKIANACYQLRNDVALLVQEKRLQQQTSGKLQQDKDIIAVIMRSGDHSDNYLVDQLLTFLAAGHDTTASALTWTAMLLSQHPGIQDRLREECNTRLANRSFSEIDASVFDAESMPYLTAVCNETLRLYPTVPATMRRSVRSTKIGNQVIPRGTFCLINQWGMNRDDKLWGPDADIYSPARWLHGGSKAMTGGAESPYAFLTFLHGPRSCIGQSFARMEMKCLLAALVMRFRFEMADPDEQVEIGGFLTIKPMNGLRMKLHDLKVQGIVE